MNRQIDRQNAFYFRHKPIETKNAHTHTHI